MCVYTSGLTYRLTNQLDKSMEQFVKPQMVLRHQPEVLFQVASLNEELGNDEQAIEWWIWISESQMFFWEDVKKPYRSQLHLW